MPDVAILKTGAPPPELAVEHGDYPAMFSAILGQDVSTTTFDVQAGDLPDPTAFDAAIITGSSAGVYDGDPWIASLLDWIRAAKGRTRLIGICFGHQAMAQALGGQVRKSDRGWGVGLHRYEVASPEPWMRPASPLLAIPVSHQDQVVEKPADARVILRSAFTPFAGLAWNQDAISLQCHPEFSPAYAAALTGGRRGRIDSQRVDAALESLAQPNDRAVAAAWLRQFISG
jgi:GMP synthase-like glutamine amidotransferase